MHTSNQLSHPADNIFSTEALGAIYTPEKTTFRVWAPTAGKVTLKLHDSPSGGRPRLLSMSRHSRPRRDAGRRPPDVSDFGSGHLRNAHPRFHDRSRFWHSTSRQIPRVDRVEHASDRPQRRRHGAGSPGGDG